MVMDSVKQHLLRAQQRMKIQADKHRSDRDFEVSDKVFLKLQPYLQSSLAPRANHKRVGEVAYRLDLPPASKVHPAFHVSLLRRVLAPDCQVLSQLPSPDDQFQFPEQVLQQRVVRRGSDSIVQVLVKWNASPSGYGNVGRQDYTTAKVSPGTGLGSSRV